MTTCGFPAGFDGVAVAVGEVSRDVAPGVPVEGVQMRLVDVAMN